MEASKRPNSLRLVRTGSLHGPSPLASPMMIDSPPNEASASDSHVETGSNGLGNAFETPPCTPTVVLSNPFAASFAQVSAIPPGITRPAALRRNSSFSSSVGDSEEEETTHEWTEEEESKLKRTFDTFVTQANPVQSPFDLNGPLPSNLTQAVARAVMTNQIALRPRRALAKSKCAGIEPAVEQPWRHSLKSTRHKILQLVKESQQGVESTPRAGDSEATPKRQKRAPPLARQNSMDFLPESPVNISQAARIGSMLQNSAAASTVFHSQAHPSRLKMQRTNSLSTIPGSPSRPEDLRPPPSSNLMARTGSGMALREMQNAETSPSKPSSPFVTTPTKGGLGSAFPSLNASEAYPTPQSSLSKNQNCLDMPFGSSNMSPTKKQRPTLGHVPRVYVNPAHCFDSDCEANPGSAGSTPLSSPGLMDQVPSPLSSSFDLNDLSLESLREQSRSPFLEPSLA